MRYPANLAVLQAALGVVVHGNFLKDLATQFYGAGFAKNWQVIKQLQTPATKLDRNQARAALGLSPESFVICSFGLLGESQLNHRLLTAWAQSALAGDPNCNLIFVGKNEEGDYGKQIPEMLRTLPIAGQLRISGLVDEATYRLYLQAADVAVQLHCGSHWETSGTVLDCLNYGLPTVANAHGGITELPQDVAVVLSDEFTDAELTQALECLWQDSSLRQTLRQQAQAYIREAHNPQQCAARYVQAIEGFYADAEGGLLGLARGLPRLGNPINPNDLALFARRAVELYSPKRPAGKQLLIDISELAQRDAKTGIQRVVRSVMQELLQSPPQGYRVEPVYATAERSYRYARRFTAHFLNCGDLPLRDDPVDIAIDDIFWSIDLQPQLIPQHWSQLAEWRQRGVKVFFTVYDILPLIQAETTFEAVTQGHRRWLEAIAHADGLIGISHTVIDDVQRWLTLFGPKNGHSVRLGWTHLGADVNKSVDGNTPTSRKQAQQLNSIHRYPAFLLVGTLEPRKMQDQALAAFEWLWQEGEKVNLVIVGKVGWKTEDLAARLRNHPENGRHLFWLESISDEYLEQVYNASACLIAASKNEGFGLPLIEAAMRGLPIIARDIPVFREVCGEHAVYFQGYAPQDLAFAVQRWLYLQPKGQAPSSAGIPWMTWAEATKNMLDIILQGHWQSQWQPSPDPGLIARYWGSDDRLRTAVGSREGSSLASTGQSGYLLYSPYLHLRSGRYVAELRGRIGAAGCGDATADVSMNLGEVILSEAALKGSPGDQGLLVQLPFEVIEDPFDVEIRIEVTEHSDLFIDELLIRRASRVEKAIISEPLDSQNSRIWAWWGSHPKMQTQNGIRVEREMLSTGTKGYLIFGNHTPLPAGRYRAQVQGTVDGRNAIESLPQVAYMEVAWNNGRHHTDMIPLKCEGNEGAEWIAEVVFQLNHAVNDAEIRVHVSQNNLDIRIQFLGFSQQ